MISGMAIGWDVAVAEACVLCGVPFVAAVPFEGQELRWPEASQARYLYLLRRAEHIHVVSLNGYSNAAFHARNRWMVDQCEAVVALWDGSPTGGTANCVAYANSVGKATINLWNIFVR